MGLIEDAKEAVRLVQKIDNLELYRKILDLQAKAIDLTEQLKQKDEIISHLRDALDLKGNLVVKDSVYFLADKEGKVLDGPFCTKCFDVDKIKCRIVADTAYPQVKCQKCNVSFDSAPTYNYLVKPNDSRAPQCYVL